MNSPVWRSVPVMWHCDSRWRARLWPSYAPPHTSIFELSLIQRQGTFVTFPLIPWWFERCWWIEVWVSWMGMPQPYHLQGISFEAASVSWITPSPGCGMPRLIGTMLLCREPDVSGLSLLLESAIG